MSMPEFSCRSVATQNSSLALLHVSHHQVQTCGGEDILYVCIYKYCLHTLCFGPHYKCLFGGQLAAPSISIGLCLAHLTKCPLVSFMLSQMFLHMFCKPTRGSVLFISLEILCGWFCLYLLEGTLKEDRTSSSLYKIPRLTAKSW